MDWKDIERLRAASFTVARRGYDQREVDKFLGALVDWLETDAAKDLGEVAVERKLELVGKSTAQILLTTEKESEELRRQTEAECAQLRSAAEAAAHETRRAADEYARKVREKADQDAQRTADAASAKAHQAIEEGERRRAQIEARIRELDGRRDGTLVELERLSGELTSTIQEHRSHTRPARDQRDNDRERGPVAKAPQTAAKR
jgi:DivIVA domain-containing protein